MLPKVLLVCLLDLIAAKLALGWNHVSRAKFEYVVNEEPLALVACKSPVDAHQLWAGKPC
jgi:protein disulfide-isomerase A1